MTAKLPQNDFCGVLAIDKPAGFTSFDVIAKLRGILRMKRLGHGGTLDPMATGVLPVFVGKAARACDLIPDTDKRYRAGFQLGVVTDTQDCTGRVLSEQAVQITKEQLMAAFAALTGEIFQTPPMYSAVSVNGKRLYELARQGVEIEREPRRIVVKEFALTEFDVKTGAGVAEILCSKGTYVRTLLHDVGQRLGCGAMMTSLVRTQSAGILLKDCWSLSQIEVLMREDRLAEVLLPVDGLFELYPALELSPQQERLYRNGVKLDWADAPHEVVRVYGAAGDFLGLGRFENAKLRVLRNFF